ncbi:hypothetical protein [Deinococcus pimensis]|uniref:hypothetical protein n=1 Tax=Deinococcus pimensis TaxID=309888 RepID=UPI0004B5FCF1|nr:hypothetical protein [Deinococcus pimensis]
MHKWTIDEATRTPQPIYDPEAATAYLTMSARLADNPEGFGDDEEDPDDDE